MTDAEQIDDNVDGDGPTEGEPQAVSYDEDDCEDTEAGNSTEVDTTDGAGVDATDGTGVDTTDKTEDSLENPPKERLWASQWYRITPRSFAHTELFFDPDRVLFVFAGESYKSFLLRRDGREDHARELGETYRTRSADAILADERHEAMPATVLEEIRLRSGSWFRKPKLVIVGNETERTFYHGSRRQDVESLAADLAEQYPSVVVVCNGEKIA